MVVVGILLLFIVNLQVVVSHRDPLDKPNFVLFFVDDLGYADCGFTGNPTTATPNIDWLAFQGKILTTWYSACSVCSCSRAALMTGRQYTRSGVKTVFGPTEQGGLNLKETTLAEHLRNKANYSTGIIGKWHLGQRKAYLPGNRGFDHYLGVPYSVDMGNGRYSSCGSSADDIERSTSSQSQDGNDDPAAWYVPLVHQAFNKTQVIEQPVDFTTLSDKYNTFATEFIETYKNEPFFLYVPFSHVHVASGRNSELERQRQNGQYSTCSAQNSTKRGVFGDALADVDASIGVIYKELQKHNLLENTLILFTSDNGPWVMKQTDGGSAGIFTGEYASYTPNTAKGSTWEGGLREPAFAYWAGQIRPFSRSAETISTLDVFPTFSALAGLELPADRPYDGCNAADILLDGDEKGKSQHDFLFFYGMCSGTWPRLGVSAVRHGSYKAHFCTNPGVNLAGMLMTTHHIRRYHDKYPLLFNVDQDPGEAWPLSNGTALPTDPDAAAAMERIMKAYAMEVATFEYGTMVAEPDGPGEGPGRYGLCCNRATNCSCPLLSSWTSTSLFRGIGTKGHHDRYHNVLGETNHAAATNAQ